MYQIFLWIHIISYSVWLLAFVGSLFMAYKVGKTYQSPDEKRFMRLERKITSIGAHIGALGILISGGAMVSIPSGPQWGWFNFGNFGWLATKQTIFCIILILVVFSVKKSIAFKKQVRGEGSDLISDDARRKWKKAYNISVAVYLLVVVNTILGLTRPF